MNQVIFDKQEQLDKITTGLLQGETIIAVYDGKGIGTGFIGLTNKRVIIQDNSFNGRKLALTSIPYSKIDNVSYVSDKNVFRSTSVISFTSGTKDYGVQFSGEDKASHAHNVILWNMVN